MCDHCGCRAVTPIEALMAEHERLLDLARAAMETARAGDTAAAGGIVDTLTGLLWQHTRKEETGLFAVMRENAEFTEHVDALEAEHADLEARFGPGFSLASFPGIVDLLRQHIHAEEYGLFPAALASLSGDDWAAVGAGEAAASEQAA